MRWIRTNQGLQRRVLGGLWTAALLVLAGGVAFAQEGAPGRIIGHIDGARYSDGGYHLWGWACQQGRPESVDVHIYAEGSADGAAKGGFVLAGKANLANEPAVDRACQDMQGHQHRFDIPLPGNALALFHGQKIVVHGIRVMGSVENSAIAGSGAIAFPDPPQPRDIPASYPRLSGSYVSLPQHPRVFVARDELRDMAQRSNRANSFSARRFAALADWTKRELAAPLDWDGTYAGCDMEIYLRAFAFEPKPAYGNDRSDDALGAAMKLPPGSTPLHGAAVVAARLALYAALVKAGAAVPPGGPAPDAGAALAKRILLAWADRGFRDESGQFRRGEAQYCDLDPTGKPVVTQYGTFVGALTLSRGVIYSVQAQDLLQGLAAVSADEQGRLDRFHRQMGDAIRAIHNAEYDANMRWKYSDEVYNNQFVGHITALLAIARLVDDKAAFGAALDGGAGEGAMKLPWIELFNRVIYGTSERPMLRITPNTSVDPLKSQPAYSSAVVAAGEINDRYRNSNPAQGIGYPMGSLQGFFMQAELLQIAGYDAYAYRGAHGQSLEMATQYYACFAQAAGFHQTISAENAKACPDGLQYVGKIVNGVDANVVIGAYRFPGNVALTELDGAAKQSASAGPFSLEPILYGKWRD